MPLRTEAILFATLEYFRDAQWKRALFQRSRLLSVRQLGRPSIGKFSSPRVRTPVQTPRCDDHSFLHLRSANGRCERNKVARHTFAAGGERENKTTVQHCREALPPHVTVQESIAAHRGRTKFVALVLTFCGVQSCEPPILLLKPTPSSLLVTSSASAHFTGGRRSPARQQKRTARAFPCRHRHFQIRTVEPCTRAYDVVKYGRDRPGTLRKTSHLKQPE